MAQTTRRLRILSIGYTQGIGQFYVRFGVVRKQSEKVARNGYCAEYCIGVVKVFKDFKVVRDFKIFNDLKDFSLLFYLAVVVGDTFSANIFDDVAQVLFGVFKDFRVVKVVNDLKGFLSYCFIWLA